MSYKRFARLEGCKINSMWPIFKTEMLIYQSRANLDVKILWKINHLLDPEIRKMQERNLYGNRDSTFHCGP